MDLLLILTSINTIGLCLSKYQYVCPSDLNWRIRGRALCNSTVKYSCLQDENTYTYREFCRMTPRLLAPGNKYVIRGNLDGKNCNESMYQPFIFRTNQSSKCVIKKSLCSEKGQVVFSNGSTTEDQSCRCDYSRSYAPIQKPSNPCHCVPSVEDCSCFLKLCPDKTHLSAEYTCVSDFTLVIQDACRTMEQWRLKLPEEKTIDWNIDLNVHREPTYSIEQDVLTDTYRNVACILVLAGLIMTIGFFLIILLNIFGKEKNVPPKNKGKEEDPLKNVAPKYKGKEEEPLKNIPPKNKGKEEDPPKNVLPNNKDEEKTLTKNPAPRVVLPNTTHAPRTDDLSPTDNEIAPFLRTCKVSNPEKGDPAVAQHAKILEDHIQLARTKAQHFLKEELRIVLVGKAGVGKSSTGNSLLGHNRFQTGNKPNAVTTECMIAQGTFQDKTFFLVDTPGIYSSDTEDSAIETEIMKCMFLTSPGPHAILFVVQCSRIRKEDYESIETFLNYFGKHLKKYVITVFTHADGLGQHETLEQWIKQDNKFSKFLKEFNGGYCQINNAAKRQDKDVSISNIIHMARAMKSDNIIVYTDSLVQKADEKVRQRQQINEAIIKEEYEQKIKELEDLVENNQNNAEQVQASNEKEHKLKLEKVHSDYTEKLANVMQTTREEFLKTICTDDFKNLLRKKLSHNL